ncbi:helix-turn-helix transcriptional regulator [Streptomyces noursei]|uniref:helix-turn-helix transcriptional regulator n=1 Tax=Streptomyces noursei TaxID=1971 RepID=UPI0023B80A6D|nr:LuxR family transcriptional regulator [Streptomyces noursei]
MTTQLHGRDDELRTLREMIGRLPGTGGVLTVLGEPGIGKTTLLRAAVAAAEESGAVALETTGVEAEARVPFAGLHQLLRPVMAGVGRLPAPQRTALQSAFGVVDGPVPEVSMVAFAVLNLLAEAAEDAPLLLALDDAQWLDAPTQETLAFVARRVSRDPILVVAALHKGHAGPFASLGAADLDLAGLDDSTARHVLAQEAGDLSLPMRERILREARGNPLALVELPVAWRDQREAAQQATPGFLPLTARLERAFAGRVAELPADSRDVLLVAAVDHADDLAEILAAASVLAGRTLTVEALDAAVAARLLRLEGLRLLFHHPLVRSAVQMSETLTRRLSANAALAEVLADEPYRRTWHLAQSIIGPDDDIADELVANRAISLRRGGTAMAAWELERSAQLTSDHAKRGRRLLLACEYAFGLGRADQVERLLRAAERSGLTTLDRARLEWLRELSDNGGPDDALRVPQLCETARESADEGDVQLALRLLLSAALRCWWADAGPDARAVVVSAVESLEGTENDPRRLAILAVAEPVLRGRVVHDWLSGTASAAYADVEGLRMLGMAAHAIGDPVRAVGLLGRAELKLREQGRLGLLSHTLILQIGHLLCTGDWERAATVSEEAHRTAGESARAIWSNGALVLEAVIRGLRGEVDEALGLAASVATTAHRGRLVHLLACVQLAKGAAFAATGRHAMAYDELCSLFDPDSPNYHQRASFDGVLLFAEAAVHSGHEEQARGVLADLERVASVTPSPLLHTHLLYARAVLAEEQDAEHLFRTALAEDLSRWPLVRSKLELAYGTWLRRRRRVAESRTLLRSARATLELIGATGWAEQARAELRAAGERALSVAPAAHAVLSPHELQIARLATQGLSNREIGERLYLSPRTVGWHLYRIFPKLDITSRAQLASRLAPF